MAGSIKLGGLELKLRPRNQIEFNNSRRIVKLDIPGIAPKYQDMGEDEHIISWDGVFDGDTALADCTAMEDIRKKGEKLDFYFNGKKTVRIKEFKFNIMREDRITYSITLLEIQETEEAADNKSKTVVKTAAVKKDSMIVYTVVKGDCLWKIAERFLNDPTRWTEIAKDNKIKNPRLLQIGTKLKIKATGRGTNAKS